MGSLMPLRTLIVDDEPIAWPAVRGRLLVIVLVEAANTAPARNRKRRLEGDLVLSYSSFGLFLLPRGRPRRGEGETRLGEVSFTLRPPIQPVRNSKLVNSWTRGSLPRRTIRKAFAEVLGNLVAAEESQIASYRSDRSAKGCQAGGGQCRLSPLHYCAVAVRAVKRPRKPK